MRFDEHGERPLAGDRKRRDVDGEQNGANCHEHVERGEHRREIPGCHHADQAGDHAQEGREIDPVEPGQPFEQAFGDPGAVAQCQQVNRDRDGGVIDQRWHITARDHLEIALAQELGHQEGRHAHHRRHQLASERGGGLDRGRGGARHAGADHGGNGRRADGDGIGSPAAAHGADAHRADHRRLRQRVRRARRHALGRAQQQFDAAVAAEHAQHQQERADHGERDLRQIGEYPGGRFHAHGGADTPPAQARVIEHAGHEIAVHGVDHQHDIDHKQRHVPLARVLHHQRGHRAADEQVVAAPRAGTRGAEIVVFGVHVV